MKKFYLFHKNKAFIIPYTILIISLIVSFILLSQLIINSKLSIYKNSSKYSEDLKELDFLDRIIMRELNNIEKAMLNDKIHRIEAYFDSDINKNKIFLSQSYMDRISIAGYKIIDDKIDSNYLKILKTKLQENFKNNINLHFYKIIEIENESYTIFATINYNTSYSTDPQNLNNERLKRIWIKKND
ncbi:MAG: hypothetical protein Q4A58_04755 [Fusobacterium sp.]|uniref:hypothetical protein n=1 Tax=Fusobacterium sp. TaxID=68766 RepID=UPI0026DC55E7|nr:hypothetical protein [Fusobacterium sp.]MDO4690586.1 hypothetical protein [Fusobacterium sp.]